MDADQNHDGFLDISEISAALQAKVAVSDSDPNLESKEIARKGSSLDKISTKNFPDSVLREVLKLDKNHDGFLDATEISTALTLLSKYSKFSGFGGIAPIVCGSSSKAQKLRKDIQSAGRDPQRRTVIVSGESGLEKESIASLIHEAAGRRGGNLLYRVHCESCSLAELYGTEEKPGLLDQLSERAGADSVLITNFESVARQEEMEELQRLFERRTYYSRFHGEERQCDARILAVCDRVPDVLRGSANITQIPVAPLKQRSSDLPQIASAVLLRIAKRRGSPRVGLSPDALHRIRAYGWPDNLREVASALERALYIFEADRRAHPYIPPALTCDHVFTSPAEVSTEFLRYNLLSRVGWLQSVVRSPLVFDDAIKWAVPPVFLATLAMLFWGPQAREGNAALTVFWAWWWPLGLLSYPLLSRMWCAICPFMATGEWAQQAARALNLPLRPWPAEVRTHGPAFAYWMFAAILMWEELWALPDNGVLSASLLLLITAGSVACSVAFEKRMWCRHLCPIGAMNGLYSKMAVLEIRSPKGVCSGCTTARCTNGAPVDLVGVVAGAGCPLESSPSKLADNTNCVMCFRCVKICENGSPEFNLRPPGTDFGLPFLLPVPGTELPSTFTSGPWQAALLALLQGAVLVHHVPLILADLGVPDAAGIAAASFGAGAPFALHAAASAALLALPAALFVAADAAARLLEPANPFEEAGAKAGAAGWAERLTRVAYGYLPLVWASSLAYWSGLGLAEGGTVLPRLAETLGLPSAGLPQVVFGHDAIMLVQGAVLALGVPPSVLLTLKLCEENGLGPWRQAAQMAVQAALTAELWHLMVR